MAKLSLVIAQSTSLKDKRMVIRRVKDRVRERVGVVVNEVGSLDDRQRAELGCAVASGDRQKALELLDQVVRVAQAASDGQVVAVAKDAWTFDVETAELPAVDDRTGSGDKAVASDDWIPEAWRDEE
jgi:uncharacterized protein YlxP (DUF503 family)